MDQEIQAEYDRLREEGMSAEEAAQQARYNVTRVAELTEMRAGPRGPTPQPPFAKLPPMVGGALDALVAFGTVASGGLPALDPANREYMAELWKRTPEGVIAAGGAGALASLGVAGLTTAAKLPTAPTAIGRLTGSNPYGLRITQNAPSLGQRAMSTVRSEAGPVELRSGALGTPMPRSLLGARISSGPPLFAIGPAGGKG